MELPNEAIIEFIELYRKNFNLDIPFEDAQKSATRLIALFEVIFRPLPKYRINDKDNSKKE